jgi:hypothetical protein
MHFLVRLPPFTKLLLDYQDRNFDVPDRLFHSIGVSYLNGTVRQLWTPTSREDDIPVDKFDSFSELVLQFSVANGLAGLDHLP